MKSLMPWLSLAAATTIHIQGAFANNVGIDAYRQGYYAQAVEQLAKEAGQDPVVDYYLGKMGLYGYGQLKNNAAAIRFFTQSGEKGYLPAQQIMARYTLLEEKNLEQALYWFKKAADADDVQAQMYCASAYLFGVGTKKNVDVARRYYIAAAKNGNSIAQFTLADYFIASRNSSNKKLGLIWLNKAAEQKNPQAQLKLGQLYAEGNGVARDLAKAKEWVDLSVQQGYLPAMYYLGEMAQKDNNLELAKNWYTKAADQNYTPAQLALANLYLDSKSSMYDVNTGFLTMLKAAQNASSEAQLAIASLYRTGQGVPADEHLAKEWELKAAASAKESPASAQQKAAQWLSGNKASTFATSGYQIGGILSAWQNPNALKENIYNQSPQMDHINRQGLYKPNFIMSEPNEIAISEYYDALANVLISKEAASNDLHFPRYPINDKYTDLDTYVPNSPSPREPQPNEFPSVSEGAAGVEYFTHRTAASAIREPYYKSKLDQLFGRAIIGDSEAQFTLGQMYQDGIGVNKDTQEAIKLYKLAAEQKDLRAEYMLGALFLEGSEVEADPEVGISWLQDAAYKGDPYAQFALAHIKERGYLDASGKEVVKIDPEQAIAWYHLAAGNDYGPAQYRLAEILVIDKQKDMSVAAKDKRNNLIKRLYKGASEQGVEQATLPLAFFNAMSTDKDLQTAAFNVAKKEAENGNGQAALLLGIMYDRGIATSPSKEDAVRWYQKASSNPITAFILGTYYSQGVSVGKDIEKGKALLQQSADAGFGYANLNLAVLKQQNSEEFLPELDTALSLGNSTAGLLLADYYLSIANNDQKMQQARQIYQNFAEKGDKTAQLKLAFMFEQGLGGEVDMLQAQKWYTQSAEQGQPVAQFLLGHLYQLGWLDKKPDYAEAKKWYSSAEASYAPAAVALGFIYDTVDDNYQQALASYQVAALKQDATAQFNLGLIYEKGKGRPVDLAKAKELYQLAADQGHSQAMVQLAGLYFNGPDDIRDENESLNWYKKAALLGDRDALYQLGLFSETGVTTKINFADALNYYKQAAEKNNDKAMLALARIYQYGLGIGKNNEEAARYYKALAERNNAYAQYQLATLYLEGVGGERNPEEGKRWLQQAQKNGNSQARKLFQWREAQSQPRFSFIEPASLNPVVTLGSQPPELLYMDALNEWDRGEEILSRSILNQIKTKYPNFDPAKRAYDQLNLQSSLSITG